MNINETLRFLRQSNPFDSEQERCIALHNFVRDEISFGFTSGFERVSPEQTLKVKRGHCNAQADLFRALLIAVGIPASLRFVQIDKRILYRAVPQLVYSCLPSTLFHAVTLVSVDGVWINTDSYIFDPEMFRRQKLQLAQSGLSVGFGLTSDASCEWSANEDSFSQARATDLNRDNPIFASLADALADKAGNNTLLGIHFNQWLSCIPAPLHHVCEKVKSPPAEPGAYHWGASKALVTQEPPGAATPLTSFGHSVHLRLPDCGCRLSPSPHQARLSRQNSPAPKTLLP